MRILASRKRDSVTGEEVVAVSHVVASSGGTRYSNSINHTGSGASEGAVILSHSTLDGNPGKLAAGIVAGSSDERTSLVPSPSTSKKGRHKIVRKFHGKVGISKVKGAFSWRNRIGKGAEDFLANFLSEYCCAWNDNTNNLKREGDIDNCGGAIRTIVAASKSESEEVTTLKESKEEERYNKVEEVEIEGATGSESGQGEVEGNNNSSSDPNQNSEPSTVAAVIVTPSTNANVTNVDVKQCNEDPLKPFAPGTTAIIKNMRAGIYHEKQVKSLCALHALNNLLQDAKAFKQEDLDKICSELDPNSWVNPHKSVFGLGNYDINVIMTALQQKKLEAIWFDKRKDPSEELNFDNIYGFILNIPSECKLGWLALPIKRKHWVAIRNLPSITEKDAGRNNFYNLDSKFDKPESIGSTDNLIEYLRSELRSPEKELFLVVIEEVGRRESWRKNPPPPPCSEAATSSVGGASGLISTGPLLPVPGDNGNLDEPANRRTSNDSGVVDLLPDLRDINVVDLNKEDLMRRQSSGVWSDLT